MGNCARVSVILLASLAACTSTGGGNGAVPSSAAAPDPSARAHSAAEHVVEPVPTPVRMAEPVPTPTAVHAAEAPPATTGQPVPFSFEWQRSSGAIFRDRISIADNGQLTWVAQETTGGAGAMHAIHVQLDDAEVASVRQAIDAEAFFSLPTEPEPSGVQDAEQLTLHLRYGEREHRVRVETPLPPVLRRIQRAVTALLTPARQAALRAAGPP